MQIEKVCVCVCVWGGGGGGWGGGGHAPCKAAVYVSNVCSNRNLTTSKPGGFDSWQLPVFFFFFFFFSSLTAVPSENQCLSSGAYEWPVLVSLKHAVGLSQHCFLLQEWLSKLMACSPTCELHSRHLGCGLELILAVYREVHAHSFVLKCLLQWHVHAQHY